MALPASFSLTFLALTLWISWNLLLLSPTTAVSHPADGSHLPELSNSSKEFVKGPNSSEYQIPEFQNVAEKQTESPALSLGILPTSKSSSAAVNVSSMPVVLNNNTSSSSTLQEDNRNAARDEGRSSVPCDRKGQSCEVPPNEGGTEDASDTNSVIPVSKEVTNVSTGRENKVVNVKELRGQNISDARESNTNLSDYNPSTIRVKNVTNLQNSTHFTNHTGTSTVLPATLKTPQATSIKTALLTTAFKTTLTTPEETTITTTSSTSSSSPSSETTARLTTTKTHVPRPLPKVKGHSPTKVKSQTGRGTGTKKPSGHSKGSVSSVPTHHLAKHFTGFVQHVWLPNSTPRPPGPIDDGPFGSILWKDKKYLVSVLIPIGVGFAGAMMIIVMAYASRAWRKRKERLAHAQGLPGPFLEAATSKNDDMAPLQESSDDEF